MSKINIFALGGLNEVGKNMYVVKVDEEIYIFDAGMKFNVENAYGVDYILPDYHYLKENEKKINGIFISHAHEIDRFISVNSRRVLHISCYGKINESMPKLDIWDFIILSNFLGYHDISNRKQLRKNVKFSYIFPRLIEEFWNDFNSEIPIIL